MFAHVGACPRGTWHAAGLALIAVLIQGCQSPLDTHITRPGPMNPGHTAVAGGSGPPQRGNTTDRGHSSQAQESMPAIELTDEATLDDYLVYAAAHSAALRAAHYRWRAAAERVPQVRSLPDPMLGYGYFLEDFTARRAMEQHMFEVSQTFPWFGKLRLRGDAASAAADAAAQEFDAVRLALFLDVRRAYYELYQLGREIELTQETLELLQQFESIVRAQFRAGRATHADVVRSQVELGRTEDRLRQLGELRRPAAARLNAVLNRAADAPVAWPRDIPDERLGAQAEALLQSLERENPQLRVLERQIEQGRIEAQLAERDFYPDVTVGAMGALEGDEPLLARISINIPIWRERYQAAVREANARRIATAYTRQDQASRLGAALHEALFNHDDAQRRLELYTRTLLPKAQESLEASLTAFQAGTATFLELLDAERTLLEFRLAESRARTDRATALAQLDALVGRAVPRVTGDLATEQTDIGAERGEKIEDDQTTESQP